MRICLFSSYTEQSVSNNLLEYLKELKRFCDRVIFITNHRLIDSKDIVRLKNTWVELEFVANGWYDFGMYQNYLLTNKHILESDEIILANDSMLIIKPLDDIFERINEQEADYISLTNSYADERAINDYNRNMKSIEKWYKPLTNYKFQESYFLVLRKEARALLEFKDNKIYTTKEKIVLEYEIRWSELAKNTLKTAVMFDIDYYLQKNIVSKRDVYTGEECRTWWCTLSYEWSVELLKDGFPLLKRHYLEQERSDEMIEFLVTNQYHATRV